MCQTLHTFPFLKTMAPTRRICLTFGGYVSWWSFLIISWPLHLIQGWYCEEKSEASHPQGLKGERHYSPLIEMSQTRVRKFIWRRCNFIHNLNGWVTLPSNQHYLYPFMITLTWNSIDLSPKSFFLDVKTTFVHTFLHSELPCLPSCDSSNLCTRSQGSDY